MTDNFNPMVSIVIPVYNGSNYMKEAIDSALSQTYKNIEVLVVNDGSIDDGKTREIALSYKDRIKYFEKENGGVSTALNFGISKMQGEYFAWLSHDDYYAENRIEEDIKLLNETGYDISYSKLFTINENKKQYESIRKLDVITSPYDTLLLGGVGFCSMTIKKTCFKNVGLFNENNITMQDIEMTLLLSKTYHFIHNKNTITYNRDHSNRGTYIQRKTHNKDSVKMGNFINNNFTVFTFFNFSENEDINKLNWAYMKLGSIYKTFECYQYADECYKSAYLCSMNKKSKSFLYYKIGSKNINRFPFVYSYKLVMFLKNFLKQK